MIIQPYHTICCVTGTETEKNSNRIQQVQNIFILPATFKNVK